MDVYGQLREFGPSLAGENENTREPVATLIARFATSAIPARTETRLRARTSLNRPSLAAWISESFQKLFRRVDGRELIAVALPRRLYGCLLNQAG